MFEQTPSVNSLADKVEDLLSKYEELKQINENLRQELVQAKAGDEAKDAQIAKLQEELRLKDQENEDIFGKIEAVLNT